MSIYLGFSSQSHFSRVFKQYTNQSPSSYRANRN
ncbi:MAG: AraC family transcriptional regulator [Lachnospiraceae bacterium]|nr:AraC family transcriptional regulator [Lachnospiraceae bacterium]